MTINGNQIYLPVSLQSLVPEICLKTHCCLISK